MTSVHQKPIAPQFPTRRLAPPGSEFRIYAAGASAITPALAPPTAPLSPSPSAKGAPQSSLGQSVPRAAPGPMPPNPPSAESATQPAPQSHSPTAAQTTIDPFRLPRRSEVRSSAFMRPAHPQTSPHSPRPPRPSPQTPIPSAKGAPQASLGQNVPRAAPGPMPPNPPSAKGANQTIRPAISCLQTENQPPTDPRAGPALDGH